MSKLSKDLSFFTNLFWTAYKFILLQEGDLPPLVFEPASTISAKLLCISIRTDSVFVRLSIYNTIKTCFGSPKFSISGTTTLELQQTFLHIRKKFDSSYIRYVALMQFCVNWVIAKLGLDNTRPWDEKYENCEHFLFSKFCFIFHKRRRIFTKYFFF